MPSESLIKCFLSVCETLSFTETARRLFMSQQSVSKSIARLERELGFPLFARTHHYVRLTRAGEEYRRLFRDFELRFEQLAEELTHYYETMSETLSVGHLEWLDLSDTISGALSLLRLEHPGVRLLGSKHAHAELGELFLDRKLDMILTYREFEPKGPGLRSEVIMTAPLVLLVSPEDPLCSGARDWRAFRSEPFIKAAGTDESMSDSRARAQRQCRELGFTPRDLVISPNLESAYLATELGQGVLISTMLSRMARSRVLSRYPLGRDEELLCLWYEDSENPLCADFSRCLKKFAMEETHDFS